MYLFFDIECASVNKTTAKICAFGYCLTDEEFNVIEKEDILINPHGGFHLTDRKGEKGLVLPYDYDTFKNRPDFPAVAEKIYALLQNNDTLVCGHATGNDVKYLNLESRRFFLPSFRFEFADTQYLYMCRKKNMKRQYKLETIAEELGVEFTPHRAVDDAYAAMKIAEAMSKEEGVNFRQLLKKYGVTRGKIENYTITPVSSAAGKREAEEAKKRKERRERALAEFHRAADSGARRRNKNGAMKSVSVCFSRRLEEDNERSIPLLLLLYKAGAKYAYKTAECTCYVCFAEETGARRKEAEDKGVKICTPEELRFALEAAVNSGENRTEKA